MSRKQWAGLLTLELALVILAVALGQSGLLSAVIASAFVVLVVALWPGKANREE